MWTWKSSTSTLEESLLLSFESYWGENINGQDSRLSGDGNKDGCLECAVIFALAKCCASAIVSVNPRSTVLSHVPNYPRQTPRGRVLFLLAIGARTQALRASLPTNGFLVPCQVNRRVVWFVASFVRPPCH